MTDLIDAIMSNNINHISELLDNGWYVYDGAYGLLPLIYACSEQNIDMLRLLIEKSVCVDDRGGGNRTALMHSYYRSDITKLLLDEGANPILQDRYGLTALMMASFTTYTREDIAVIKTLLHYGSNIDQQDYVGETALMKAVEHKREMASIYLLDRGASSYIRDYSGRTVFDIPTTTNASNRLNKYGRSMYQREDRSRDYMSTPIYYSCSRYR